MSIDFISSKDSDETRNIHTKSNNIEVMVGSETDKIIEKLFKSLLRRYQEGLEKSMKGGEFSFDSVNLLHYNLEKTSLKRTGLSYVDSPEWLKNKKVTMNLKNNNNNCFQYALTVSLNYQNIKKDPQKYQKLNLLLINMIGKE